MNGFPSGSIKNFSKFHEISVLVTGSHIIDDGDFIKVTASSLGKGNRSLKNTKMGCAFLPFTSHFSNNGNLGSNPFPGRTYFKPFKISSPFPFSYKDKNVLNVITVEPV